MNTKKTFFALVAIACFALTSCTSSSASDDAVYEDQSMEKSRVKVPTNGMDKSRVRVPSNG
jgi:outer membrane protein assembly factor BamE (lipoprotein component of BamABCDE complex)